MGNKKIVFAFVSLVIIIAGAVLFLINNKPTGKEEAVRAAESAIVTVTNSGFVPETITIKKGQKVEWINTDTKPHQVAPDPHPVHSSYPALSETDAIQPNESMTFTFGDAGEYQYHDELQPLTFKAIVIVE